MQCRIVDLRCKEVINICDGCRLGFVNDVEIDMVTGRVVALVVPGPCRFLFFFREDDFVIPWNSVRRVSDDIILIEFEFNRPRPPRERWRWFGF